MKTPKFIAHIIDKNGVATKRHKNVPGTPENSRDVPAPKKSAKKIYVDSYYPEQTNLPVGVAPTPAPLQSEEDAAKHELAVHQPREDRFGGLTVSEAARINRKLINWGYMLDQWKDYQEELEGEYYELRAIRWMDDEDAFAGNERNREAYLSFADSWDRNPGWLKYPDMSQKEKDWEAMSAAFPTFDNHIGDWSVTKL